MVEELQNISLKDRVEVEAFGEVTRIVGGEDEDELMLGLGLFVRKIQIFCVELTLTVSSRR